MQIKYKKKYDLTRPAVVKLWFGERYLIKKFCLPEDNIPLFLENVVSFADRTEQADMLYFDLLRRRIGKENLQKCVVEVMLSSFKGEELLAKEQALLNQAGLPCLNRNKVPARPSWIWDKISSAPGAQGFFRLKGRHRTGPAVVKLWVGAKFFIWKCKDIQKFAEKFNDSLAYNIDKYQADSNDRMNPLVKEILRVEAYTGTIEVVLKDDKVPRLLREEKRLLDKYVRTSVCINKTVKQYHPQWIKESLSPAALTPSVI